MQLIYTVIKSEKQYDKYCKEVIDLLENQKKSKENQDKIDLLTVLIEKYDDEQNRFDDVDPISLLKAIMQDHKMRPVDLAKILGISKSLMSDVLNYRRAISKVMVRKLSDRFKMRQEAFNRPYWLKTSTPKRKKKSLKAA